MRIEYLHASRFGNGAEVAEEFRRLMANRGVEVHVHHVHAIDPRALPPADVYVFSSPGRMGGPIRAVRRLLRELTLPAGTRYALLSTELTDWPARQADGEVEPVEVSRYRNVRPYMHAVLREKGLVDVAEAVVHVKDVRGPLEDGWERIVASFADRILASMDAAGPVAG
ncbi:MAG TPA: hypothetical protein VK646_13995 [Actinomycetota bacterium]|nr:hypothetical protein [Actinomycetota bacterium]